MQMSDAHEWTEWYRPIAGRPLIFCKKCGKVQKRDGKNKPCRGVVQVDLRSAPTTTETEGK